jgi:hypothetical protein
MMRNNILGCNACLTPSFLVLVWLFLGIAPMGAVVATTSAAFALPRVTTARMVRKVTKLPNCDRTTHDLTTTTRWMVMSMTNNSEDEDDSTNFLDRQFFDPTKVKDSSPFKWFASMVENDYETAEALYASTIIAILVLISQELIRFQVLGEYYIPFKAGGGSESISSGIW